MIFHARYRSGELAPVPDSESVFVEQDTLTLAVQARVNGPDVSRFPTHAGDLTVYGASKFNSSIPIEEMANSFEETLSYRVIGGAQYV